MLRKLNKRFSTAIIFYQIFELWKQFLHLYLEKRNEIFFELSTVTKSELRLWANMLSNTDVKLNSEFFIKFMGQILKLPKLIRFALPNHWFLSVSYLPLLAKWHHQELSYVFFSLRVHLPLLRLCTLTENNISAKQFCFGLNFNL